MLLRFSRCPSTNFGGYAIIVQRISDDKNKQNESTALLFAALAIGSAASSQPKLQLP